MTPVDAHANRMLRSEGVTDAVIDAIAACGASPRRESFLTLAKSFGFDGFSYIVLGALSAHPRIVEHWTSSGTAWSARYAERGYHLVDPRVTLTRNRTVPLVAVQLAVTLALIAPPVLDMFVRAMPAAVPPETTETVSVEAASSLSDTEAMLAPVTV